VGPSGPAARAILTGALVIRQSTPFTINGVSYRLGAPGMRVRVAANGTGVVKDIYLPAAELSIAGRATVAR
jgi:hypothetical protein